MSSKRKEYHVDHHAAKVAEFFFVCESHINPGMRVKIPAAMMAKGYSNKESKNWTLQMQVYREVENQGIGSPPPPKAVAVAALRCLIAEGTLVFIKSRTYLVSRYHESSLFSGFGGVLHVPFDN